MSPKRKLKNKKPVAKKNGNEKAMEDHSSWIEIHLGLITSTADILKDDLDTIKKRKIQPNAPSLKEGQAASVILTKNIVTGVQDAIAKAIKDLQNASSEMVKELEKRLPNESEDNEAQSSVSEISSGATLKSGSSPKNGEIKVTSSKEKTLMESAGSESDASEEDRGSHVSLAVSTKSSVVEAAKRQTGESGRPDPVTIKKEVIDETVSSSSSLKTKKAKPIADYNETDDDDHHSDDKKSDISAASTTSDKTAILARPRSSSKSRGKLGEETAAKEAPEVSNLSKVDKLYREDPNLKEGLCKVEVERLAPCVVRALKRDGFVNLKGTPKHKRGIQSSESSDSDDEDDSDLKAELDKLKLLLVRGRKKETTGLENLGMDWDEEDEVKRRTRAGPKKIQDISSDEEGIVASTSTSKKVGQKKRRRTDSDTSFQLSDTDPGQESESPLSSSSVASSVSSGGSRKKLRSKRKLSSSSDGSTKRKNKRSRGSRSESGSSRNESEESESDDSDDEETPSSSKKGRKNIRKIKSSKELREATRSAEKMEEKRRKRLADRENLFEAVHKVSGTDNLQRLILDVDSKTSDPVIEVDGSIVKKLKPHQADGIRFMFNACFETVEMIKDNDVPGGCILAHCMGLGKTLQTVALLHTLLTNKICGVKTALVICPLSTVANWHKEIQQWTRNAEKGIRVHKIYQARGSMEERKEYLRRWHKRGGIGIIHYDAFRLLVDPKGKHPMLEDDRRAIKKTLLDPGPDIVICDEGHLLKNSNSMLSRSVNSIRTLRRIALTGTPLQNNLKEYHTMMNFVKPNLLGTVAEFTNRFVNPIKNGQHSDSTDHDVQVMKRRAHVLHRKLECCVQRFDYSILAPYLPPKYEYIINVKMSEKQERLYKHYLENVVDSGLRRQNLLRYYSELVKVWSHPVALTLKTVDEDHLPAVKDNDFLRRLIKDESSTSSDDSDSSDENEVKSKKQILANIQTSNGDVPGDNWWIDIFKPEGGVRGDPNASGKIIVLQEILKACESIGDKVLVFSQFLTSLDVIEEFLAEWDKEAERKKHGRWRRDREYFRLDGRTKVSDRQKDCETFNKKSYSTAKLFLISTRAGSLGINLFGANRVVIFDASWNPSQDMQSIFRVYRFGQDKPCYIYRLIARGTMEEKIIRRQISKLSLSSRVVDEHQVQRHFRFDDVNEMYIYDEDSDEDEDVQMATRPEDDLLAELLAYHKDWIYNYEEFDSLLENKPDEGLTKEEKEAAWTEYKTESKMHSQHQKFTPGLLEMEPAFVKIREKLAANYPEATLPQIQRATHTSFKVSQKIRDWLKLYKEVPDHQRRLIDPFLNPLKDWLKAAVGPRGVDTAKQRIPWNMPLLPPVPGAFSMPVQLPKSMPENGVPPSKTGKQGDEQRVQQIQSGLKNVLASLSKQF